jgi:glyoxylase-like metal-dependent hydrolase (beta-lactamase superfamily II)
MMQDKGLRLIDMDEQIIPGLTAVPIPGHTPGQIALLLESENEKLLTMADLLHSPMQFAHPEWSSNFDVDTGVSVPTRRAMLGRAADENMLALFYHLTFPGLGRVARADKGFTWTPLART